MYGYPEKVSQDVKTLNEIIQRQGNNLLLDVIAENVGKAQLRFKMPQNDLNSVIRSLSNHLTEAIRERT